MHPASMWNGFSSQADSVQIRRPELAVRPLGSTGRRFEPPTSPGPNLPAPATVARCVWSGLPGCSRRASRFLSHSPAGDAGILEAMKLIGQVAETNYGLVFDVRSVAQPENLAYSDLGLGLHTDNPYREPVPGFQALHALIVSPDGGESLFADGFALAEHVRDTRSG